MIYEADCLTKLGELPDGSVDFVYIDPPFNSGRVYEVIWRESSEKRAFEDRYGNTDQFVDWMRPRCVELARVLKSTGMFVFHCDPHANYGIRRLLQDELHLQFVNEIVWQRTNAHSDARQGAKHFGRVHDTLYLFAKHRTRRTWTTLYQPYSDAHVEKSYRHVEPETGRRYRLSDMSGPGGASKGCPRYEVMGVTRYWRYSRKRMSELIAEGRVVQQRPGAVPRYKHFLDESHGVSLSDVWTDIPALAAASRERIGYPTQKPRALLERLLSTASKPGDLVLDAFCGCGTTLVAAASMDRKWIGIDVSPTACRVVADRLLRDLNLVEGRDFFVRTMQTDENHLRGVEPYDFQNWAVNALGGIPNPVKGADKGIDGRLYLVSPTVPKGIQRKFLFAHDPGEQLSLFDDYVPVQAKQKDKVGRPDIDAFETALRRDNKRIGIFVAFGYTRDAHAEIRRAERQDGLRIHALTVREILEQRAA